MTERRRYSVKAYSNKSFLNSRDARPLRILAEYLEPESRFVVLGGTDLAGGAVNTYFLLQACTHCRIVSSTGL